MLTDDELTAMRARNERAKQTVFGLSEGTHRWRMSSPPQPDLDPDLILSDALADTGKLLAEIDRLKQSKHYAETIAAYSEAWIA